MDNQTSPDKPALQPAQSAKVMEIDPIRLENFQQRLKEEQSLFRGIVAGAGAAVIGAIIWAIVTVVTDYQIGWMAVGIGFLVGYAVRQFGKGVDKTFGYMGAGLSLLGIIAGNILTAAIVISQQEAVSLFRVLFVMVLSPSAIFEILGLMFSPIDLLFYGIALYEGYKFSLRRITQAEMAGLLREKPQL